MINIAIVEDSKADALLLKEYVESATDKLAEKCAVTVFDNALKFLDGYRGNFEIVFMDIELPGLDGMNAAKRLRGVDADVILIFVTNMAQYAVGGYAVDAMDFMVKPISFDNIYLKLSRAFNRINSHREEKLVIQGKNGASIVNVSQIRYIEVMNHKITLNMANGDKVTATGSLTAIEEKLSTFAFSRCNNCYLVNLDYVTGIDDYTVFLGGDTLVMSRARKKPFLKDIADHLGGVV
ncbi:MAG: LytTR family DNA-binding domain-containing protein [Clostridia bacterium]|nr:LytTR family DNA-binding domain-containing protein [Clostridia bacterium]